MLILNEITYHFVFDLRLQGFYSECEKEMEMIWEIVLGVEHYIMMASTSTMRLL